MTGLLLSSTAALFLFFPNPAAPEVDAPRIGVVASVQEPSDVLDVGARVVSSTDLGSTVRIEVDLSILPRQDVPTARVRGAIFNGPGFDDAFGIPDEIVSLTRARRRPRLRVLPPLTLR